MHAKVSTWRFQPDTADEGVRIIRDIMIPSASKQQGFRGAFMLRHDSDPDKHITISLWETKDDLLASYPPDEIIPLLEPLDEYIVDNSQDTCDVLLAVYKNKHQ
jgi:hypothetical protein